MKIQTSLALILVCLFPFIGWGDEFVAQWQPKDCKNPTYKNISYEVLGEFLESDPGRTSIGIAKQLGFECLAHVVENPSIGITTVEFTKPQDDVKNWQNLLTLQFIPAPQGVLTAKELTNRFVEKSPSLGVEARLIPPQSGISEVLSCYEYQGRSQGDIIPVKGQEYGLACLMRVSKIFVISIMKQSRTPLTAELNEDFVKTINSMIIK